MNAFFYHYGKNKWKDCKSYSKTFERLLVYNRFRVGLGRGVVSSINLKLTENLRCFQCAQCSLETLIVPLEILLWYSDKSWNWKFLLKFWNKTVSTAPNQESASKKFWSRRMTENINFIWFPSFLVRLIGWWKWLAASSGKDSRPDSD